jgi:hypothetical protein
MLGLLCMEGDVRIRLHITFALPYIYLVIANSVVYLLRISLCNTLSSNVINLPLIVSSSCCPHVCKCHSFNLRIPNSTYHNLTPKNQAVEEPQGTSITRK